MRAAIDTGGRLITPHVVLVIKQRATVWTSERSAVALPDGDKENESGSWHERELPSKTVVPASQHCAGKYDAHNE
jgi:hypothetical protein